MVCLLSSVTCGRGIRRSGTATLAFLCTVATLCAHDFAFSTGSMETTNNGSKNLARMNCGAKIQCITPDGRVATVASAHDKNENAAALILDDNTLSCPLQEGETTFIITLPAAAVLDRFTFVNENAAAKGEMKIAVSNYQLPATSGNWTEVNGSVAFTSKRLFNLSLVGVEAKYVKLSFKVAKAGQIAALGLYGDESLDSYAARQTRILRGYNRNASATGSEFMRVANTTPTSRAEDRLNFNFANLYAKARVVYVSSGTALGVKRMIDDDATTAFEFAPADQHPTVIIELAQSERLHRVSAIYKAESGRLDVYVMNELGEDHAALAGAKLVATVSDTEGHGKAAVEFDPQGARYVALRWSEPARGREPFEIAEISAFGDVPLGLLDVLPIPNAFASNQVLPPLPETPPFIPVVSP